jgi:transposase-like protein
VAGWVPVSTVRPYEGMARRTGIATLCGLQSPGFADGRDDLSRHPKTVADVVSSHVVGRQPENRGQCGEPSADPGAEKLPGLPGPGCISCVMVRPGRDRLWGTVEVDETYVGGREEGVIGRGAQDKALVVIAVEKAGRRIGRVRMRVVEDFTAADLCGFVRDCVEPGSTIRTDGRKSYLSLPSDGFVHDRIVQKEHEESASELLPGVHLVASLLKRWRLGPHQGRVRREHLGCYLDEFTFRFNRRTSRHRGKLFYRLVQQAVAIDPVPYKQIIKPTSNSIAKHNI